MDSVDCILTDPPYPDQYEEEYDYRANGIDFLNEHRCLQLIFWSARFDFPLDYTAIHMWDKKMGAGRAEYERIFERHGQNGYLMFREYLINSTVAANYVEDEYTGHPSQKPRKLLMRMIDRLAKKCGTIYDPFMGSGSTGVAAVRMGRRFIGIERNPAHFETAKARIIKELAQGDLFLGHNEAALHRPHEVGSVARAGSSAKRMGQTAATEEPPHSSAKRMNTDYPHQKCK